MHRREKIEREAIEEHTSRPQDQHHVADRPRLPRYSGSHSELLCEFGGRLAEELKVVPAASHVKGDKRRRKTAAVVCHSDMY